MIGRIFTAIALTITVPMFAQGSGAANSSIQIATSTKPECLPHNWSYGLRDYTWLGVRVQETARSFFLYYPNEVGEARARADAAVRELDSMEQEVDTWRASAGRCFGEGDYGKKVADKYRWVKQSIAEQRKEIEESLVKIIARNKAAEAERVNFENWRNKNRKLLICNVDGMKLEIVWITKRDTVIDTELSTVITIETTNMTTSKILKPRNHRIWGYENGSDVGGRLPIGVSLTDSFGNNYKLTSITPSFLGSESRGIRPGQTVTFKVRFGDAPLQNSKLVRLTIEPASFGQSAGTTFKIPIEAFYGTQKGEGGINH